MSTTEKKHPQGTPEADTQAQTPERAPFESNYGYESDHPSYKLRGAGDWSPRSGNTKDHRPANPQQPVPPAAGDNSPAAAGKHKK